LKGLRLITFCAFPPVFSLIVCADDVIRLLAGSRWDKAALILQWLAPIGALHVGYTTIGWLMQSQGRADRNFVWGCIAIPIYILSFILGLPWGAVGVAAAYAGANILLIGPGFIYGTRGTLIRLPDVLAAMLPCLIVTMATLPAVYAIRVAIAPDWLIASRLALTAGVIAAIMVVGAVLTYGPASILDSFRSSRRLFFRLREA
jgi:PST family polysaccharide transporter